MVALRRSLAAGALAAALVPASASAATDPALFVGAGGTAHAAWLQEDGRTRLVQERRRLFDGALTSPQYVSLADANALTGFYGPAVKIGADRYGNAVIAWMEAGQGTTRVMARRRGADGSLGPAQPIAHVGGAEGATFDMAVDPAGNAVFAWMKTTTTHGHVAIETRRRAANGTLSATQALSYIYGRADKPRVGIDAAGNAVIAWIQSTSSGGKLQARGRAADGTLSPLQNVASPVGRTFDLAVAPDGRAAFAYAKILPEDGSEAAGRLRAADGTLAPAQVLSAAGSRCDSAVAGLDATGRATFGWVCSSDGGQVLWGRTRSPDATLGTPFQVDEGSWVEGADLAVDRNGNATFIDIHEAANVRRVHLRRRTAGGTLGPLVDVTPDDTANRLDARLGLDGNGHAFVAWTEIPKDGGKSEIRLRRRAATGELGAVQVVAK